MAITDYLWHLWATPPQGLQLACPTPPEGQSTNPFGTYSDLSVAAAYNNAALASAVIVVVTVVLVYLMGRASTSASFTKRYVITWIAAALATSAVAFVLIGPLGNTTALAGSCESDPSAFRAALPIGTIISRAAAGAVWTLLAYPLLSAILTATIGRLPGRRNGFFHARGTPFPRFAFWS